MCGSGRVVGLGSDGMLANSKDLIELAGNLVREGKYPYHSFLAFRQRYGGK